MALHLCKACGINVANPKQRRILDGRPYAILFEIAQAAPGTPGGDESAAASVIHRVLAAPPTYICKPCFSALTKYDGIKSQMEKINEFIKSILTNKQHTASVS